MQRDVKIGIAIGVLLIALIAVFWWARQRSKSAVTPPEAKETEPVLPAPAEPVQPAGPGTTAVPPPGPGATAPGGPTAVAPAPGGPAVPASSGPPTGPAPATGPGTPPTAAAPGPTPMPGPGTTTAQPSGKRTYKVQEGDSLAIIAKKVYGDESKWHAIYAINRDKIGDIPGRLKVGTELVIPDISAASLPTGRAASSSEGAEKKHVVAAGDTLSSIATKYYGSASKGNVDRIYAANRDKIGPNPDDLKVGMELVIPSQVPR